MVRHIVSAVAILLCVALLPARTPGVRAAGLQISVAGAPMFVVAIDNPGVAVRALGSALVSGPASAPGQLYEVFQIAMRNISSVPFYYSASDFTLENVEFGITHKVDPAGFAPDGVRLTGGTLAPGAAVEGDIAFVVANNEFTFILHWSHTSFVVPLDP